MARANTGNGKQLATQQSVNGVIEAICDIMRRSNGAGARAALRAVTSPPSPCPSPGGRRGRRRLRLACKIRVPTIQSEVNSHPRIGRAP